MRLPNYLSTIKKCPNHLQQKELTVGRKPDIGDRVYFKETDSPDDPDLFTVIGEGGDEVQLQHERLRFCTTWLDKNRVKVWEKPIQPAEKSSTELLQDIRRAAEDVRNTHMDPPGRGLALTRLYTALDDYDYKSYRRR